MSDQQSPIDEPPVTPPPTGTPYAPPPTGAPYAPPPAGTPYAPPIPAAAYGTGLALPPGVVLASRGRRVGAYFLSLLLVIVTLGIGYVIWGLVAWGKGTSPALQVLGMRAWKPADQRVASWGTMALRNVIGGIVQGILGFITGLISFILFLADDEHRTIPDRIGGTIIVHDPGKALG